MDNGLNENFQIVWNGQGQSDTLFYNVTGLISGRPYRFYVIAINAAGNSSASSITTIYACQNPGHLSAPQLNGQQTASQIPIRWNAPLTTGGCPITSYAILRNGGSNSTDFIVIH